MAAPSSIIRDPVHGDIEVHDHELRLLDTPQMQRLRGVRQLGTAYLAFPGAQHTRFEHSLGTLHMTARMIDAVNRRGRSRGGDGRTIGDDEIRVVRAAALLHDATHIPFGHNIEDQSGLLERHDTPARFAAVFSPERELGAALESLGLLDAVLAVLGAVDPASVPVAWTELLSDTICPDILDYLRRDAYYTGLNLHYDDRVMQYFEIDPASGHLFVDVAKRGLVREDILSELVRVLEARYFFSERVYYHHAKIAAGAMIARAVESALRHERILPSELYEWTDESLLVQLELRLGAPSHARGSSDECAAELAHAAELIRRFRSRQLFKRACVFPRLGNEEIQDELVARFFDPARAADRHRLEREIQAELGPGAPTIVLYCPAPRMQLKEAATHARFPGMDRVQPLSALTDRVPRLADLERRYRDLWKLYVLATTDDRATLRRIAAIVAERLPEASNAYRP